MKVSVALQVYIPKIVKQCNIRHGDIYVIEVVQEEVGGLGSRYLDEGIKDSIDYAILGEPTSNKINIRQKGRVELKITFEGKSVHASRPWLSLNPLYRMGRFISILENLEENVTVAMEDEAKSTVAPTVCVAIPNVSNVTPGECSLVLDWRNTSGESEAQVLEKIRNLLSKNDQVEIQICKLKTYTGLNLDMKRVKTPFSIDRTHPFAQATAEAVISTLGREVEFSGWTGATDGGYFMEAGIPIVGFGPGESEYEHSARERISLQKVKEAMECYPAIVANIGKLEKKDNR